MEFPIKVGKHRIKHDDSTDSLIFEVWTGAAWDEAFSVESDNIVQVSGTLEIKRYREEVVVANTGTSYAINLANGSVFNLTLTGDCTFTFTNPPASGKAGSFTLILKQDATGGRTTTWPASVKWAGATEPALSDGANEVDILSFVTTDAGTTWYGFFSGGDMD